MPTKQIMVVFFHIIVALVLSALATKAISEVERSVLRSYLKDHRELTASEPSEKLTRQQAIDRATDSFIKNYKKNEPGLMARARAFGVSKWFIQIFILYLCSCRIALKLNNYKQRDCQASACQPLL